jgi:hypothetical protein
MEWPRRRKATDELAHRAPLGRTHVTTHFSSADYRTFETSTDYKQKHVISERKQLLDWKGCSSLYMDRSGGWVPSRPVSNGGKDALTPYKN